ncbi:MAG: PKD domain-containing protein, partial [Saprospiraceae bacterium]
MLPANGQGASVSVTPPIGTWPYVVEGSNGTNCAAKDTALVVVHGFPTASITKPGLLCVGKTITLIGQGSIKGSGTWSTVLPATVSAAGVFSSGQKGKFPVFFSFTDQYGCPAPVVRDTVCVIQPPTAAMSASSLKGCVPFEVQFSNTSSTVGECQAATYKWTVQFNAAECPAPSGKWSFVEGNENSYQPKFRFESSGQYVVTLSVTNDCGNQSVSQTVEVGSVPNLSIQPIPDACGATALSAKADIKSCNAAITQYNWLFEGGTPASASAQTPPPVTFSSPGNHIVSLAVTNTCGTSTVKDTFTVFQGPTVAFNLAKDKVCIKESLTPTNASTGTNLGYTWRASGPGRVQFSSVTAAQPTLTFPDSGVYIITLAVANAACDTIRVTDTILVSQPPTVKLAAIPDACGQATIMPIAAFSSQSRIDKVNWAFPPQATVQSSDKFVPSSFTINQKGEHKVRVQVENSCGTAADSLVFRILQGPVAAFQLDTSFACKTASVKT